MFWALVYEAKFMDNDNKEKKKEENNQDLRYSYHCPQKTATKLSLGFLHTQKLLSKNMEDNRTCTL